MTEVQLGPYAALVSGKPDAPRLIVVHGFPDVPRSWEPAAALLAAGGLYVVAPWLRGYAPGPTGGAVDPRTLAEDLLALADTVSPHRPVAAVGHDWGAVALYAALHEAPHRFSRAVALSVPHPAAFAHNLARHPRQLARSWYMMLFQLPFAERVLAARDFALVDRLWRAWSPGLTPPPALMDEIKRTLAASLPGPIAPYRAAARALLRGERLPADPIRVPTLYLHGARDGCVGPELMRGQERCFERLESEVLPEVGHFLHVERPAAVAKRILEWVTGAT